jgi:hypothetical protein
VKKNVYKRMNRTGKHCTLDAEVSVLIKLRAVVTWCGTCGVINEGTDFSTFGLLLAPEFKIKYSVQGKETDGRAKITHKIELVFI